MTQHPFGTSDPKAYQAHIRTEADAFLTAYAAADPGAPVKACPGWTVNDLVDHLGQVHQWAQKILQGHGPREATTSAAEDEDLAGWYEQCVRDLLDTLATTDPTTPCWTFQTDNEVARFWSRRQALELVVHRVDAEVAAGGSVSVDASVAADGIAEIFDVWFPRITRRVGAIDVPAPILVACSDRDERWLLRPAAVADTPPEPPTADGPVLTDTETKAAAAVIRGPAEGLLMLLWKRQNLSVAGLSVEGDAEVVETFLTSHLTA